MTFGLQMTAIIVIVAYFFVLFHLLKKQDINVKYSLLWIFAGLFLLVMAAFPQLLVKITVWMGVQLPSNALFLLTFIFIISILMSLTVVVSHAANRIRRLTQQTALLEKRIRELEQRISDDKEK